MAGGGAASAERYGGLRTTEVQLSIADITFNWPRLT